MTEFTVVFSPCIGSANWNYVSTNKQASTNLKVCCIAINNIDPINLSFSQEFFSPSQTMEENDKFITDFTFILTNLNAKNITTRVKQDSPVAQSILFNYEIDNVEQDKVDALTTTIASVCKKIIDGIYMSKIDYNAINEIYFEEENYLGLVLPKLIFSLNNYDTYVTNTDDFEDSFIRCNKLRNTYTKKLFDSGYKTSNLNSTFNNFPIDISNNSDLLGQLISQLSYTKYLENSIDKKFLQIKLDQNSESYELNLLSSILRENIPFENLILVFDYQNNKDNNFLSLNHIIYDHTKIYKNNNLWLPLLQSAYTELLLIIEIDHGSWHIEVAHIIYIAKKSLENTEILKIFEMAEKNVFATASEVKNILFGTTYIFQQILNNNIKFTEYMKFKIVTFFNNFNIDTIFNKYILNGLNPNQNWIIGMDSNIKIIKKFINKIINKSDISLDNKKIIKAVDEYNDKYLLNYKNVSIEKYLEILFVVGTAFHSTTFQFTKELFTDIFYLNKFTQISYGIGIGTIFTDINISFGDIMLYTGEFYKKEVDYLFNELEKNRQNIEQELKYSTFKNYNFSTKENISLTYQPNTFTSYI
jgi:hypothetical protein